MLMLIPGLNGTRLLQSGYDNVWDYFWGKRNIHENSQEMTSSGNSKNQKQCPNFKYTDLFVDMFDFLKTIHSLNGIFKRVSVYPDGDVKVRI